jgi:hypothetical protein
MLRIDSPDPDPDPTLTQVNWQDTDPLKVIRIRNAGSADQDLHRYRYKRSPGELNPGKINRCFCPTATGNHRRRQQPGFSRP